MKKLVTMQDKSMFNNNKKKEIANGTYYTTQVKTIGYCITSHKLFLLVLTNTLLWSWGKLLVHCFGSTSLPKPINV